MCCRRPKKSQVPKQDGMCFNRIVCVVNRMVCVVKRMVCVVGDRKKHKSRKRMVCVVGDRKKITSPETGWYVLSGNDTKKKKRDTSAREPLPDDLSSRQDKSSSRKG